MFSIELQEFLMHSGCECFYTQVFQAYAPYLWFAYLFFLMVLFKEQKILILLKSNLAIFSFMVTAFVSCLRILCLGLGHKDQLLYFLILQKFYDFNFYIEICDPSEINVCLWSQVELRKVYQPVWVSSFPTSFC